MRSIPDSYLSTSTLSRLTWYAHRLTQSLGDNAAIIVGELGAENNGSNVAEDVSLQYAQDQGIGYLG